MLTLPWIEPLVLGAYFVTVTLLSVFGAHRLVLMLLYFRGRDRDPGLPEPLPDDDCPTVLVQLPVFNERFVVERLVQSVAELDWPRDRLRIQVLDDSTDDTVTLSQRIVERYRRAGFHIELLHRTDRAGYKAGALAAGLEVDDTPFVALLDADFVPSPDFLRRAMPLLVEDETIGMVQARWTHINRDQGLLTRAQAILLDGHFIMEHGARFRGGRFFNFNGTAGIWRRQAIDDAGGWEGDTLTEDLDLSYRAQLAGWRFRYVQALEVPAELPEDPRAFKNQQHRWAKGSIQTAKKLLPRIWRSDQPAPVKIEATFHLANNLAYPLMVVLLALLPIALQYRAHRIDWIAFAVDLPVFVLATLNLALFYALAERELRDGGWLRRLPLVPFVLGMGAALTPNNARAVWEAARGKQSPFVRTPKAGEATAAARRYRPAAGLQPVLETAMGVYYLGAVWFAVAEGLWVPLPLLFVFAVSFLILGVGSLMPQFAGAATPRPEATPQPVAHIRPMAPRTAPPKARPPQPTSTPGRRVAGGR